MPSTYAHERFGNLVLDKLPDEIRLRIFPETDLYHIGLQGPDPLFYYNPLRPRGPMREGSRLHCLSGREFFSDAAGILSGLEGEEKEAGAAYLAGLLCHFTLDSLVHGFINEFEARKGVSHSVIEGDLDRTLIVMEGRDPLTEDLVANFHPSRRSGHVVGLFYPVMGEKVMTKSLRQFVRVHHLIYSPGSFKRHLIYGALKMAGQYENMRGHVMSPEPENSCRQSSAYLVRQLEEAAPTAVHLITGFPDNLEDPRFTYDFEGEKH